MSDDEKKGGFYISDDDFTPTDRSDEIPVKIIQKNVYFDDEIQPKEENDENTGNVKKNSKIITAVACAVILCVIAVVLFPEIKKGLDNSNAQSNTVAAQIPVSDIRSDKIIQFEEFDNGAVVLTGEKIEYIYSSGPVKNNTFSYTDPCMKVCGEYVFVYDRGKTDYRIEKNGSVRNSSFAENELITADITEKGVYAVSFVGKDCTSVLSVYASGGREVFRWNCADYYIGGISLSPDGGKVAAVLVNFKNGGLSSVVKIFDIDYNSDYASFELDDTVVCSKWYSSSKLLLEGKNGVYYVNKNDIHNVYPFNSDYPEYYDFTSDGLYLLTLSNADSNTHNVICITPNGKIKYSTPVQGKVNSFSATGKFASVLTNDGTLTVNRKGENKGRTENIKNTVDIVSHKGSNYISAVKGIYKYSAFGNAKAEKTEQITGVDRIEKE